MRSLFTAAVVCATILFSHAANPPNLAMLAAKSAATVKAAIPGSEGAVHDLVAVVKKRTHPAPNFESHGGIVLPGNPRTVETPDDYGVLFVIQFQHGAYKGPPRPTTPEFNPQRAEKVRSVLRGCLRATAVQEFAKSDATMVVDVLFGQYVDTHLLQQAYSNLTRLVEGELQR
jgi:hypothetical protein